MNLNQITLPASDIAGSAQFYRLLGCLQIVDSPHYARFESPCGEATFSVSLTDSKNHSDTTIYFEVDDVDQTYQELVRKGLVFAKKPENKRWLWREALLYDPHGNPIKIYHAGKARRHPPWRVENSDQG